MGENSTFSLTEVSDELSGEFFYLICAGQHIIFLTDLVQKL
jgi:hypothetical protein